MGLRFNLFSDSRLNLEAKSNAGFTHAARRLSGLVVKLFVLGLPSMRAGGHTITEDIPTSSYSCRNASIGFSREALRAG